MSTIRTALQFNSMVRRIAILAPLALFLPSAFSQAIKIAAKPRPQDSGGSLSLSVSSSAVAFTLIAQGLASGSSAVTVSGSTGSGSSGTLHIYGYFASATSALTGEHSGVSIPSSAVLGQVASGISASPTAFTQSTPLSGSAAGLQLVSVPMSQANTNYSFTLNLEMNLIGLVIPADTYTGTLTIQAQEM
jgi:hypothetical protein